jgi:DNA-binding NarL/FixJ family response regulator
MVGPGGARNFLWTLDAAARPQRSGLPLSPRQHAVAELAACGATAPEIARELGIGPHTVRQHLKVVYRELEVGNRIELAERLAEEDK